MKKAIAGHTLRTVRETVEMPEPRISYQPGYGPEMTR